MKRWRPVLLVAVLVLAAFGAGFAIQYNRAERLEARVHELERDLRFQELATLLGAATVESQRGSFEAARRMASDFFTGLQENVGRAPPAIAPEMDSILARRDAVITALSRSDPASADTLAAMFVRYRITWEATRDVPHALRPSATPAAG